MTEQCFRVSFTARMDGASIQEHENRKEHSRGRQAKAVSLMRVKHRVLFLQLKLGGTANAIALVPYFRDEGFFC